MPGSSSTSFIPKHTPSKPERRSSPRQVFFGTLLVRVLFIATLIAALAVFLYLRKLDGELTVEVTNFKAAASAYETDADKLEAVVAMNNRLLMAKKIFAEDVSIHSLFVALERSVIGTVQLDSVEITRSVTDGIDVVANVQTDNFDSTMFQRSVLSSSEVLGTAVIEDVSISVASNEAELTEGGLTFTAKVTVDPASIPALPVVDATFVPVPEPEPVSVPVPVEGEAVPLTDEATGEVERESVTEASVDIGFGS